MVRINFDDRMIHSFLSKISSFQGIYSECKEGAFREKGSYIGMLLKLEDAKKTFNLYYSLFELASMFLYLKERNGYPSDDQIWDMFNNIRHNKSACIEVLPSESSDQPVFTLKIYKKKKEGNDIEFIDYGLDEINSNLNKLCYLLHKDDYHSQYNIVKNLISKKNIDSYKNGHSLKNKKDYINTLFYNLRKYSNEVFRHSYNIICMNINEKPPEDVSEREDWLTERTRKQREILFEQAKQEKIEAKVLVHSKLPVIEEADEIKKISFGDYHGRIVKEGIEVDIENKKVFLCFTNGCSIDGGFREISQKLDSMKGDAKKEALKVDIKELIENMHKVPKIIQSVFSSGSNNNYK